MLKKSQVIIYKAYNVRPPDPCVVINGAPVKCFNNVIHLGHLLTENVYEFNVSKCIDNFNRQCSLLILSTVAAIYGIFYFNDIALISMALNYCLSLMSKHKNYILLGE